MRNKPINGIPKYYEFISILSDNTKEGTIILLKNKKIGKEVVMKVFPIKKSKKMIDKEIGFQIKFYPYSPKIYYENKNYFIMEKGITVKDYLTKYPNKINKFISDFFKLLKRQLDLKMIHNDTKMDNIMYFPERGGFYFIDFGFSKNIKNCKDAVKIFPISLSKIYHSLLNFGIDKTQIEPIQKLILFIENSLKKIKIMYHE